MTRMMLLFCVCYLSNIGVSPAQSQLDVKAKSAEQEPDTSSRHERMLALAKTYRMSCASGEVRLNETSLFSWATPEREAIGGEMFLWTVAGRPLAAICIWTYDDIKDSHEIQSLWTESLEARRDGQPDWKPNKGGLKFLRLDTAPQPETTAVRRKAQMRAMLAQRFTAELVVNNNRTQLRLLPQPLYRYDPLPEGVLDGGMYSFAVGTDPEAVVLLEARKENDGSSAWYYAFAPATSGYVRGFIDAKQVWDNKNQLQSETFYYKYNR